MTSRQPPPTLDAAWEEGTEVSDPPFEERAPAAMPLRAPSPDPNSKKTMLGVPILRTPAVATPAAPVPAVPAAVVPAAAVPEAVSHEPVSSRVPRAGTVMGSGGVPRVPARIVSSVSYEVEVPDDDAATVASAPMPTPPSPVVSPTVPASSPRKLDPVAAAAAEVLAARKGHTDSLPTAPPQLARASVPGFEPASSERAKPARRRTRMIAIAALAMVCIGAGVAAALVTQSDRSAPVEASEASTAMPGDQAAKPAAMEQSAPVGAGATAPAAVEAPAPATIDEPIAAEAAAIEPTVAEAPVAPTKVVPTKAAPAKPAPTTAAPTKAAPTKRVQRPAKKLAKKAPARAKRVGAKATPTKARKKAACSELSCL